MLHVQVLMGETMNSQIGDGCDSQQGVSRSLSVEHHNCHLRLYNNNINFYSATHHHPLKWSELVRPYNHLITPILAPIKGPRLYIYIYLYNSCNATLYEAWEIFSNIIKLKCKGRWRNGNERFPAVLTYNIDVYDTLVYVKLCQSWWQLHVRRCWNVKIMSGHYYQTFPLYPCNLHNLANNKVKCSENILNRNIFKLFSDLKSFLWRKRRILY